MAKLNSNNKYCIIVISLTLIITVLMFFYSNNLTQNNSENVFLTQDGLEQLNKFKKQYGNNDMIVIKKQYANIVSSKNKEDFNGFVDKLRISCLPWCEILTKDTLNSNRFLNLESDQFLAALINIEYSRNNTEIIVKQLENQKFQVSGLPYTNYLLNKFSKNIKSLILPILFCTLYILILLFIRNLLWSLITFVPAVISLSVSLSIIKIFENELTLLTSIIPLVVSVLSLSIMLHLVFSLEQDSNLIKGKIEPILLTIITTIIGFSTLYTSNLLAVRQFGIIASISVLLCSIITLIWFYCAFKLFFRFRIKSYEKKVNSLLVWWSQNFSSPVSLFFMIFCLVGGLVSINYIPVLTDSTLYFPTELNVKYDAGSIAKDVVGQPILEIVVGQKSDDIKFFHDISQIESEILNNFSQADMKIMSSNIAVQEANFKYANFMGMPQHFISYATLFSKVPRFIRDNYPLHKNYRITLLSQPVNSDEYDIILIKVRNIFYRQNISYNFNGTYFHLMTAQKEMIKTLAKSLIFAVFIVSLLAYIYYRKTKIFIIFMVINIMPVVGSFIFSNLFNLSINISTVMTYSISFGLLVDNSFHIIHAIKNNISGSDYTNSLVRPILCSGILIILSFIVFSINPFLPIKEFGITLGIITAIGVVFDLKVLPYLISRIYLSS